MLYWFVMLWCLFCDLFSNGQHLHRCRISIIPHHTDITIIRHREAAIFHHRRLVITIQLGKLTVAHQTEPVFLVIATLNNIILAIGRVPDTEKVTLLLLFRGIMDNKRFRTVSDHFVERHRLKSGCFADIGLQYETYLDTLRIVYA